MNRIEKRNTRCFREIPWFISAITRKHRNHQRLPEVKFSAARVEKKKRYRNWTAPVWLFVRIFNKKQLWMREPISSGGVDANMKNRDECVEFIKFAFLARLSKKLFKQKWPTIPAVTRRPHYDSHTWKSEMVVHQRKLVGPISLQMMGKDRILPDPSNRIRIGIGKLEILKVTKVQWLLGEYLGRDITVREVYQPGDERRHDLFVDCDHWMT